MKHKRGQSTLEYIILFTAIVVVLLTLLASKGKLRTAIEGILGRAGTKVDNAANILAPAPTPPGKEKSTGG